MRILVVEDDPNLRRQLVDALRADGYAVDQAADGEEAEYLGEVEPYDAIVLDLGLPIKDGVSVLKHWRAGGLKVPVLILTARDQWSEKVAGFDAGADDYLTKPFQMEELQARIKALIRRAAGHASPIIECGAVRVDTGAATVSVNGQPVNLTGHEYKLLSYLIHHANTIVSRTELTEHIYDQDFDRDSNTIEVFVGRLRKKLGVDVIKTVRGLGYRMEPERESA
ncbi:MAG: response regulator transcription factor [Alphaproteobacteria bacterium]|nr:MAG: response regulator transcription factor [Alphaproteobacteria bacterium]